MRLRIGRMTWSVKAARGKLPPCCANFCEPEEKTMLSREENQLLTRTGPGTAAGDYFRRFWLPALLASEVPAPDCPPVRLRILGEDLVAFRDTEGRVGLIDEFCPH